MLGDGEAGSSSVSGFGDGIHLERVVVVGSLGIGCVGSELHLSIF